MGLDQFVYNYSSPMDSLRQVVYFTETSVSEREPRVMLPSCTARPRLVRQLVSSKSLWKLPLAAWQSLRKRQQTSQFDGLNMQKGNHLAFWSIFCVRKCMYIIVVVVQACEAHKRSAFLQGVVGHACGRYPRFRFGRLLEFT